MKLTEILDFSIQELFSSITHEVFWRAMKFHPICDDMLSNGGTLFVFDKTGSFESGESVHKIDDEGWGIFISPVFLQIYSHNMIEIG